ncbi:MAG TPA: hypothetical protein VJT78_15680 [Candidatus Dormibacteraeota bacterium]|nr:hypothetical protein [Candidatus Dormibacteraeota bacterium]
MNLLADAALFATTALLLASTLWRLRRPVDAALLLPIAWLALIPIQVAVFGSLRGYAGAARNNLYFSIAIGNLMFLGLQWFLGSSYFQRLSDGVRARLSPPDQSRPQAAWDRLAAYWWYGLAIVAVGLAVLHLSLMPRVPLFELLTGDSDYFQISIDRENAAKLLAVPTIVKYFFTWDSSILLPILFVGAILYRWRWRAVFIGAFGLMYVTAPLDKFPSLIFVFSAFVALAIRDRKRAFSKVLIVGFIVSLVPAYLITESMQISVAVHHAVGAPLAKSSAPPPATNAPPSGEQPISSIAGVKLPGPVANLLDLTVRRIGSGPADVTYQWFRFFPAVHPYLKGTGWEPWRVLSSSYQSPANMVGLWAYYGHTGYVLTSLSAYSGFLADGWAEFGYLGVLIACLWLFVFAVVIELMRTFSDKRFCLACYVPCLLMLAAVTPISGIMAMTFSLGLSLAPVICVAYLLSGRFALPAVATVRHAPARKPALDETIGG